MAVGVFIRLKLDVHRERTWVESDGQREREIERERETDRQRQRQREG